MDLQETILTLLHARSEQAIAEMDKAYGRLCRGIAGNILSSREDVEEVVSDTLLAAWNQIPPEEPRSLAAYLSRITRNIAMARLRKNSAAMRDDRLKVCLEELEDCLPAPGTPETALEQKLLDKTVQAFLATLTPMNQYIFIRRYYYLESGKEIGKAAGLTQRAVHLRLMRIREGLRAYLQKEEFFV